MGLGRKNTRHPIAKTKVENEGACSKEINLRTLELRKSAVKHFKHKPYACDFGEI